MNRKTFKPFPNLGSRDTSRQMVDKTNCIVAEELRRAGITPFVFPGADVKSGEVPTTVVGLINPAGWRFNRLWSYWRAVGPGIPPSYADSLHKRVGNIARVGGDASCPSPQEAYHGFAVDRYDVDGPTGLYELAETIRRILVDAGCVPRPNKNHEKYEYKRREA